MTMLIVTSPQCLSISSERADWTKNFWTASIIAQLLYMLGRLGVRDLPEGDLLTWEGCVRTNG